MKNERKWKVKKVVIFISGGLLLTLVALIIALHILIPKKLYQQLREISPALIITYSSLHTSLFASAVTLNDLDIVFTPDSTKKELSHHFHFSKARLKEINFFKLAVLKNFSINAIELDQADISLDSLLLEKNDSVMAQTKLNLPFKKLFIGNLQLPAAKIYLHSNRSKKLIAIGDISLNDVQNAKESDFKVESIYCNLSNINYPFPGQQQTLQIQKLLVDSKKKELQIEDLKIKNSEGQTEYAIGRINLDDFDVGDLVHQKLIAGELIIEQVKAAGNTQNLFNSINDISLYVNINKVKVKDVLISYKNKNDELRCKGDFAIEDLRIEKLNRSFTPDSLQFAGIHCDLSDISYSIAKEFHDVHISKLMMDSREKIIEIESLKTTPQYDKFEYGRKRGYQGNWVKATVSHIKILNTDIQNLFHQKLIADKLIFSGCNVYVFRDRRLQRKLRNQMLPVAFMKQLPVDIRIKSLTIESSFVVYEEFPRNWIHTGTLKLMRMQMTLSPFINHPQPGDPDHMDLYASGSVMGSGRASAYFKMPLGEPEVYYVKGRFEDLSLPSLNSTAENLGVFSIRSGLLNFLNFEFTMTPQRAKGKIVGEYHDLVIDKLKIDDKDSTRKEKAGFSSIILHHVIIPRNKDISMPERKRTGKVDYLRDPTRFVTFYFIKSLLDGVRSSFTFGFVLPK
jgi:hypothetical protein